MSFNASITILAADNERSRAFYRRLLSSAAGELPEDVPPSSNAVAESGVGGGVNMSGPFELRWGSYSPTARETRQSQIAPSDRLRLMVLVNSMSRSVETALAGGGVLRAFLHKESCHGTAHVLIQDPDNVLLELMVAPQEVFDTHEQARIAAVGIASNDFDATVEGLRRDQAFKTCDDRFMQSQLIWPDRPKLHKVQTLERNSVYVVVSQSLSALPPLLLTANTALTFSDKKSNE